jgi:hypothetical protein
VSFGDLSIGALFYFTDDLAWCTLFREQAVVYRKTGERRYRWTGDGCGWDMRIGFLGQSVAPLDEDTEL